MKFDFFDLSLNVQRAHSLRVALRPASLSDAWPLYAATRNPQFNQHLMWQQPEEETAVLLRMDRIVRAAERGQLSALSAVVKATGEWVGLFRFQPYSDALDTLEMGVWLHDKFWHGRYAFEIGKLCVDAAFSLTRVERLVGASALENRGSHALMRAVNMMPTELVLRQAEGGNRVTLQEYSIDRRKWESGRSTDRHLNVVESYSDPISKQDQQTTDATSTIAIEVPATIEAARFEAADSQRDIAVGVD